MKVKPYEKLADVYRGLMKNVDYVKWSQYIIEIAEDYINDEASVLELASGNCKMAEMISSRFINFVGTDLSISMLLSAESREIKKICCNMTDLPLKIKFDFVFSAFDSVNYLLNRMELLRLFEEVYFVLEDNGIFTFDVSLEKNSIRFLVEKNTEDYYDRFSFKRINQYNKRDKIHYNRFVITHDSGTVVKELHKQKIYDIGTYFKLAEQVGLITENCYDCFTFNDITSNSERAQFILRKPT